jgi:hypothetical protein
MIASKSDRSKIDADAMQIDSAPRDQRASVPAGVRQRLPDMSAPQTEHIIL